MKQTEIRDFLVEFKGIMSKGRGLDIVKRPQNIETVTKIGFINSSMLRFFFGPLQ
jgi:hypothetical protein